MSIQATCTRLAAGALATLLAATLALPAQAFAAEPASTVEKRHTFMVSEGFDESSIPDHLEIDGNWYSLSSVSDPAPDGEWARPTIEITHTESVSIPAADLSRASSYFEDELAYEQDGYEGTLVKSGVETTPIHEVLTRQVDRTASYVGLPDNDVNRIPKTRSFTVSAASGTQVKELTLSDVTYVVDSVDEFGLPTSYTAHVNYRGEEEYLTTPGYEAVCTYEGEASLVDTQYFVSATYEFDFIRTWGLVIFACVLVVSAIAAAALSAVIIWKRRSFAMLYEMSGDSERYLGRAKVERAEGGLLVNVPADIDISFMSDEHFVELEMPTRYLNDNYVLAIRQDSAHLYEGAPHRRIRIVNATG